MASTNSQNSETLKIIEITEPPVQDPLFTQIGNCFEKFVDVLGQHMTTPGNQISKNVIDAMVTSDNPRIDKEEGTKKCSHPADEEDEEHSRSKHQKLRNNSCRDKSQIQKKRKVREVSNSESSEDDQISCQNDGSEVGYLSLPSENEMD